MYYDRCIDSDSDEGCSKVWNCIVICIIQGIYRNVNIYCVAGFSRCMRDSVLAIVKIVGIIIIQTCL